MSDYFNKDETYRDHLATAEISGKRKWIYPKKPSGRFHRARSVVAVFLLALLFLSPFVELNGHQMIQFNVIDRVFIIFGVVFWPQDFFIFAIAFLVLIIFIVTFTSIFGRLWCGWACPQTIFMEFIFRKIEFLIEGEFNQAKKLDASSWNLNKITRKVLKHFIFFAISFLIANTFLAYIIGKDALIKIITEPVSMHISGLISLTIFSFVFYLVFARFREQACIIVCPYGRFQSVLVDDKSNAVTYDFVRGEPRGKITSAGKNNEMNLRTESKGDCIDCHQCVHVCPTGIDIRNGIQLECVNCTACIDACDSVMEKIDKPKGLIRYASYENIVNRTRFHLNTRNIAYMAVLMILTLVLVAIFLTRKDFDVLILRQPGTIYQQVSESRFSNLYNLKLSNKSQQNLSGTIEVMNLPAEIQFIDAESSVASQELKEFKFFIIIEQKNFHHGKNDIELLFTSDRGDTKKLKTEFIAP